MAVVNEAHAAILQYFDTAHLSNPELRRISNLFQDLALTLVEQSEFLDSKELSVALRKLLESKDAAVRAAL